MIEIIVDFFLGEIIAGIWFVLNSIYDWIKGVIFGIPKIEVEKKRLEKKWLYKKVILRKKLENGIEIGTNGTVMEVIDKKTAFTEFYNQNGEFIEIGNELMYKVKLSKLKLKK
jgi:hypothetical protein